MRQKDTKLIIIDGMDNTGKTTLINRITSVLQDQLDMNVNIIHLEKPPKEIKKEDIPHYSHMYYTDILVKQLNTLYNSDMYDYIILDRGWISEYVYGPLYRNRTYQEITEDNIVMDYKISKIFGKENIFLYVLIGDPQFLLEHEDNLSLSNSNKELINKEYDLFLQAFYMSLLKNKELINVNNGKTEYKEYLHNIFNSIIEF